MSIRVIFLDFGNVCATFKFDIFYNRFTQETGVSRTELERALFDINNHGYSKIFEDLECGRIGPSKFFHLLMNDLGIAGQIDYHTFANIWTDVFLGENDELSQLLDQLPHEKYLLSNTNKIAHGRYIAQTSIIKRHIPIRTRRIMSYDVGVIKPDTRIYRHALAVACCAPHEAVFIDDLKVNIDAWRRIGGHGIVYNALTHSIQELKDALGAIGIT